MIQRKYIELIYILKKRFATGKLKISLFIKSSNLKILDKGS